MKSNKQKTNKKGFWREGAWTGKNWWKDRPKSRAPQPIFVINEFKVK